MAMTSASEKVMAGRLVGIASTIVQYCVENLPWLIVDIETGKCRPGMEKAFAYIREHAADVANPTLDEVAAGLEATVDDYNPAMIDDLLNHLDMKMKLVIGGGLSLAKTGLKWKKEFARQLGREREAFVLKLMNNAATVDAYNILHDKPKLLTFVTNYLLGKLGVSDPREKRVIHAQPTTP